MNVPHVPAVCNLSVPRACRQFRDRVLWLPHTVDFRGRAYPCPPHLSHLGSDLSRSLLKFARGKPLGRSGLDWLKVGGI